MGGGGEAVVLVAVSQLAPVQPVWHEQTPPEQVPRPLQVRPAHGSAARERVNTCYTQLTPEIVHEKVTHAPPCVVRSLFLSNT